MPKFVQKDIKTSFANFIWTHLTAQHILEWDDLLARAKFVMGENIVKNSVEAGEFNEFLQEHGAVEQFVRILGVAIEEKIFMYFTVYRKIVLLRRAISL